MLFSATFALLAFLPFTVIAQQGPTFTKIFGGSLIFDNSRAPIPGGPSGSRLLSAVVGGNLTDPSTGNVVASFIPGIGGELGTLLADGTVYPDSRLVSQWTDDNKFAYWDLRGVGTATGGATSVARIETDSQSRADFSKKTFLFVPDVAANPPTISIYQLDN